MGQPDQVNEGAALSALLRQWWQSEERVRKQDVLVGLLRQRGIDLTQATLSRYLDPAKPQIAREDVVRALHAVFGRPEEDLAVALALWERATRERANRERTAQQQRLRATPGEAPAEGAAPVPVPLPEEDPVPVRRLLLTGVAAVLALLVGGTLWLTAPWERAADSGGAKGAGATAPTVPASEPLPTGELASCEAETCFGLEPKHTVCSTDAITAYVDTDPVIGIELRYSAKCRAAWAKISNTTQGDVARIGDQAGRKREYTQISGRDAHTTMLPVARPEDATACAVLAARTVCATIPATGS
ncbi:DUF2690 domain-containing protein [Streptomyces sp. NPDC094032]|uniref:DUF2690 domain-containing protein n=1 Tax=Streptomyces sp. NPDC094032 TaxID=3155308 RepID=UPI0033197181